MEKSFVDGDKSGLQESHSDDTITGMKVQNVTEEYLKIATPGEGTLAYGDGYRITTNA